MHLNILITAPSWSGSPSSALGISPRKAIAALPSFAPLVRVQFQQILCLLRDSWRTSSGINYFLVMPGPKTNSVDMINKLRIGM